MKQRILHTLIASFCCLTLNVSIAWKGQGCLPTAELKSLAETAIQSLPPVTGLSIAIQNSHCGLFTYTYGERNLVTHAAIDPKTRFPVASNSKPVLMVMVLKVVEANPQLFPSGLQTKLTEILDQNKRNIFTATGDYIQADGSKINLTQADFYYLQTGKNFVCSSDATYQCPNLDKVDVKHLLLESSGFADVFNDNDLLHEGYPDVFKLVLTRLLTPGAESNKNTIQSDLQIVKFFGLVKKADPDPVKPTQSHNTDAMLLTVILERATGKTLNELLQELILTPLNIKQNSMHFITEPNALDANIARQYVYLNTSTEIENAIMTKILLPGISDTLARAIKPENLGHLGRNIVFTQNRPALDMLDLHGQGFLDVGGAGGLIAQPMAYARFYSALANGELLSPANQILFNDSFLTQPSDIAGYSLKLGYGSNRYLEELNANPMHFLTHGGLVFGGESRVLYHYESGSTIMITTDYSGYHTNEPFLFVTPVAYLGYDAIYSLARDYAHLLGNNR